MTHPFWFSEDRWALVLGEPLGGAGASACRRRAQAREIVYINVLLNKWNDTLYDALQDKHYTVFRYQLICFSWLAEARLYRLVRDRLPRTTLFSVGHRTTLRPFHDRQLFAQPVGDGPVSRVEVPASGLHDLQA